MSTPIQENTTALEELLETAASLPDRTGAGENGATFLPGVAPDGTLSWTNDKGLPNPDSVNIRGPQGLAGESGVYILSEGETIEDAPADADVVIDPNGETANIPGGGGGADLLNENGVIKQQHLPDGFPYKDGKVEEILTDAHPVDIGEGQLALMETIELSDGYPYTVNWNGTEYECVCKYVVGELDAFYVLGYVGAITGSDDGAEFPFVIAILPSEFAAEYGVGGLVMPLDGATEITISISGFVGTLQKIDEIYLPYPERTVLIEGVLDGHVPYVEATEEELLSMLNAGKTIVLRIKSHGSSTNIYDFRFNHTDSFGVHFVCASMWTDAITGQFYLETICVGSDGATHRGDWISFSKIVV